MRRDQNGAAAVEFSMLVAPFLAMMGLIMETGFQAYSLASLDDALRRASRNLQLGNVQLAGQDVAGFNKDVCRLLPPWMNCDNLVTEVRTVRYYTTLDSGARGPSDVVIGRIAPLKATQAENPFCPGLPGALTLVRADYTIPALFGFWIASNAGDRYVVSSAHTFKTEPFTGAYTRSAECSSLERGSRPCAFCMRRPPGSGRCSGAKRLSRAWSSRSCCPSSSRWRWEPASSRATS